MKAIQRLAFQGLVTVVALSGALGASQAMAANAVGRTPGSYAVDPTGAFTYSIPIKVPPGPKGVSPHIALTYNSRNGNGIVGVGWSLGGLSSIYRCNATVAQDGVAAAVALSYGDRFCMDGKRLRLYSSDNLSTYGQAGTTYQTEVADFSLVTANGTAGNGPASFTVQGKDGYTYVYGVSNSSGGTNSQVLASGTTTAISWMLSQIEDRFGNTLLAINYSMETGAAVPASIAWSPTSAGATTFNYVMGISYGTNNALTSVYRYTAATPVSLTGIVQAITLSYNGAEYLNYALTYQISPTTGRNELTQVQECAGSTQSNCLAPTVIAYQSGSAGVATPTTSTGGGSSAGSIRTADIAGNGQQDIIYATQSGGTWTWWVQFATASGFTAPINTGATTSAGGLIWPLIDDFLGTGANEILAPNGGTWYLYTWNGSSFTATSTGIAVDSAATTFAVADINGDGKADLAALDLISGTYYIVTRLNTSTGSAVSFSSTTTSTQTNVINSATEFIQGKGFYGDNDITNTPVRQFDWNGNKLHGFMLMYAKDINEGKNGEVLFNYMEAWAPNGSGGFSSVDQWITQQEAYSIPTPVNWNDDACTDLYFEGSILLAACNGGEQGAVSIYSTATGMENVVALDWSVHHRSDVLANFGGGSTLTEYTSTGTGVATGVATTLSAANNYTVFSPAGDGFDGLLTTGASSLLYSLHNGAAQPPDLVNSITDGYGINVSPSYISIAQSNYTATTDGVYPDIDFSGPMYVTATVQATSPASAGGTYTKTYSYTGAHWNEQGRGFDGFEALQVTDSRAASPVQVSKYYNTYPLFPFTGSVIEQDVYQNNRTTLISKTLNTPDSPVDVLDSTANNQRYFPFFSNTESFQYEVGGTENGDLITTASTALSYDNFGNQTGSTKVVTDSDPNSPYTGDTWTTTTTNTFDVDGTHQSADLTAWCLPLPDSISVAYTSSLAGSTAVTLSKSFTLDSTIANCRITQVVTQPTSSTYKVTGVYGFDSFNNINSDAITGINMATRTTTSNWGTTGQFALTTTNPLGQTTTVAYANAANYEFGVPSSITDPNGIVTSWAYDAFGRKNLETRPDGTETTWTPSWCTSNCSWENSEYQIAKAQLESNGTTVIRTDTTTYDPFHHVTETSGPSLSGTAALTQKTYDLYGRLSTQSFPYLSGGSEYWQTTTYDAISRPMLVQRPISSSNSTLQSTSFQYAGRTGIATDAMTNTKTTVNDVNGWLRKTTDGVGYTVTIAYDAAGSALKRTDSLGHTLSTFTYGYGIAPFKITAADADLGAWTYTPDALGEITSWEDAKSQQFSESYDALSRPLTRTEPDLFTQWTWGAAAASHNIGQLQSVCTGTGTSPTNCTASPGYSESETYDSDGRLSQRAVTIPGDGTFTYTRAYNSLTGLLNALTYPVSTSSYALEIQYAYTNGILSSVTDISDSPNVTVWTANTQNAFGQISKETLGNGIVTNRTYDAVTGWLGAVTAGVGGGTSVLNQSDLYDEVGDVTQQQNNTLGLTENFYYDNDYRLTESKLNGTENLGVTYDASGNITSRTDLASGASWTYDPNRYHAVTEAGSSSYTFTYDANGNAITRFGSAISWSSYNYPTSVTAVDVTGTENVQFSYGPDRSRWMQNYDSGTEVTYYIGGLMEEVETNITDYRHYVYAGSEPVAILSRKSTGVNTWSYLISDHIGSAAAITSSTGAVDINESFSSFGARRNPTTWSGAPASGDLTTIAGLSREGFTFQTALGQSMGLNHMNGRVQDAITGRFLSADPNIPDPTSAQSYNRFSYVTNNPLTEVDPSGFLNKMYPACAGCGGYQGTYGNNVTFESGLELDNINGNGLGYGGAMQGGTSAGGGTQGGTSAGGGFSYGGSIQQNSDGTFSYVPPPPSWDQGLPSLLPAASLPDTSQSSQTDSNSYSFLAPTATYPTVFVDTLTTLCTYLCGPVLLLFPSATGTDTDETNNINYYHYTTNAAMQQILNDGEILPVSAPGVVYFTPAVYSNGQLAQQYLAMQSTPNGYFVIPAASIQTPVNLTPVQSTDGGTNGGGVEGSTPLPIPVTPAQWVPLPTK